MSERNGQHEQIAAADIRSASALRRPRSSADEALLWDVRSVARALGLGVRTVWRLSSSGELPTPISVGRCRRWERRAIEAYVAAKVAAGRPRKVRS